MAEPRVNGLWAVGSRVADPLVEAAFLRSPGGILFQLVERLREADAAFARDYSGVPSERVLRQPAGIEPARGSAASLGRATQSSRGRT